MLINCVYFKLFLLSASELIDKKNLKPEIVDNVIGNMNIVSIL